MAQPDPTQLQLGPGVLHVAPIGTTEPTTTSAAMPAAWLPLGYTEEGSEFSYAMDWAEVIVEEVLDPIDFRPTKRVGTVKFTLAEMNAWALQVALNGGTAAPASGTNGAPVGYWSPAVPAPGLETRIMMAWTSDDLSERWIYRRCVQVGTVTIPRKKAPAKAHVTCEFRLEVPRPLPSDGKVFLPIFTGARAA
jgi:hypothetical protein